MEKINTSEVIKEVADRMGCYKKDVVELLGHFADVIIENVANGRAVSYKDIGLFYPLRSRNELTEQLSIKFSPAKKVIDRIAKESNIPNYSNDSNEPNII